MTYGKSRRLESYMIYGHGYLAPPGVSPTEPIITVRRYVYTERPRK